VQVIEKLLSSAFIIEHGKFLTVSVREYFTADFQWHDTPYC